MEKPKKIVVKKGNMSTKFKKKKKKDKFCGLKQEAVLSLTSENGKSPINPDRSTSKKKKAILNNLSEEVVSSLTPQNIRTLDGIGDTECRRPKIKFKKTEIAKVSDISKENLSKNKHKLKKKKQSLNKLTEFLNKQSIVKDPVYSLKQFLQGL